MPVSVSVPVRAVVSVLPLLSFLAGCGPAVVDLYSPALSPVPSAYDDREWATVLRENVKDDLVDYEHLKTHQEPLSRYLGMLAVVGPTKTPSAFGSRTSRLAYYLNTYNAAVLKAVIHRGVPQTVHDARLVPFEHSHRIPVDGVLRSLAELREMARAESNGDARIEFALCDAAMGSPPLADQPFRIDTLTRQLRDLARGAMENHRQVRIDHERQRLLISVAIYRSRDAFTAYYTSQTGSRSASILNVLLQLADGTRRAWLNTAVGYKTGVIPFDRALNRWLPPAA